MAQFRRYIVTLQTSPHFAVVKLELVKFGQRSLELLQSFKIGFGGNALTSYVGYF